MNEIIYCYLLSNGYCLHSKVQATMISGVYKLSTAELVAPSGSSLSVHEVAFDVQGTTEYQIGTPEAPGTGFEPGSINDEAAKLAAHG